MWELPLTTDEQDRILQLLIQQLEEELLEDPNLVVPDDEEVAMANIKALLEKCRCSLSTLDVLLWGSE